MERQTRVSNADAVAAARRLPAPRDKAASLVSMQQAQPNVSVNWCDQIGEFDKWSGKRDSNSRLPPWQGGALPTELFPLCEALRFADAEFYRSTAGSQTQSCT